MLLIEKYYRAIALWKIERLHGLDV